MVDSDKIYMSQRTRKHTVAKLHDGRCGYGKTLETARGFYFWPSMRHDIKALCDNCEECQRLKTSKPLEPFITTTATFPMEMLSVDLFHVGNKNYMVTADRFSGYIWVNLLRDTSTEAITTNLDKITRIFGIPISSRTDGRPQFRGPFDRYCGERCIVHEVSSPYNLRSNGYAEAAVKTAKHLIIKTSHSDFPEALAAWRNTAREGKPSPNSLSFGRQVRDTKAIAQSQIKKNTELPRQQMPDDSTMTFIQGDQVHVQDPKTKRWDRIATITGISTLGRTLDLHTEEGDVTRRNWRFIRSKCAIQSDSSRGL